MGLQNRPADSAPQAACLVLLLMTLPLRVWSWGKQASAGEEPTWEKLADGVARYEKLYGNSLDLEYKESYCLVRVPETGVIEVPSGRLSHIVRKRNTRVRLIRLGAKFRLEKQVVSFSNPESLKGNEQNSLLAFDGEVSRFVEPTAIQIG
ncbi:MAG: hypothetical protein FJY85_12010, partial [Deltaproteobacteria bacterium]|nr:hypothetical protein [Deltaproteobacteria bacterium]